MPPSRILAVNTRHGIKLLVQRRSGFQMARPNSTVTCALVGDARLHQIIAWIKTWFQGVNTIAFNVNFGIMGIRKQSTDESSGDLGRDNIVRDAYKRRRCFELGAQIEPTRVDFAEILYQSSESQRRLRGYDLRHRGYTRPKDLQW